MNERQTRIDDAIDRAVRDMIRRDPPAGLRGRVLSRLDAPARRTAAWPQAAAAALLSVAAIAFVVLRNDPTPVQPVERPVAASQQPAGAGQPAAGANPSTGDAAAPKPARQRPRAEPVRSATFGPRTDRVQAANVRREASAASLATIEPAADEPSLAPLPPIAVHALSPPAPLEISPIVVHPIEIPRIQPAPGSPPR